MIFRAETDQSWSDGDHYYSSHCSVTTDCARLGRWFKQYIVRLRDGAVAQATSSETQWQQQQVTARATQCAGSAALSPVSNSRRVEESLWIRTKQRSLLAQHWKAHLLAWHDSKHMAGSQRDVALSRAKKLTSDQLAEICSNAMKAGCLLPMFPWHASNHGHAMNEFHICNSQANRTDLLDGAKLHQHHATADNSRKKTSARLLGPMQMAELLPFSHLQKDHWSTASSHNEQQGVSNLHQAECPRDKKDINAGQDWHHLDCKMSRIQFWRCQKHKLPLGNGSKGCDPGAPTRHPRQILDLLSIVGPNTTTYWT